SASLSMAECAAVKRESAHGQRRVRGVGRGRKTRRALDRGGLGPARALNATLGAWDGVRITPMFGRWGYFVGNYLFACFPLRDKDHDLWIRLGRAGKRPAPRGGGWGARSAGFDVRGARPRSGSARTRISRERRDPRSGRGLLVGGGTRATPP